MYVESERRQAGSMHAYIVCMYVCTHIQREIDVLFIY